MRRVLKHAATAVGWASIALLGVVAFAPGRVELATRVYALFVAAVAIIVAVSVLRQAYPRPTPLRPAPRDSAPTPPATLGRLEHVVSLGIAGAFDLHHRLVPRLRAVAAGLLASRRRISLDDPAAARAALGDETWQLVRPDRPPPTDRLARGVPLPELERAVASLERI
jgi:hypothetical protein